MLGTTVTGATTMTYEVLIAMIKSQMRIEGLDPDLKEDYAYVITEDAHDVILSELAGCPMESGVTELMGKYAHAKHVDGNIEGVIDINASPRDDVMRSMVDMARLTMFLGDSADWVKNLKSNYSQARNKVGDMMRKANEGSLELLDPTGRRKIANIKLSNRQVVSWSDSDQHFEFFRLIGQGNCVQETVPWQTDEKIMACMLDDLPDAEFNPETGVDLKSIDKNEGVYTEIRQPDTPMASQHKRQFFQYSDDTYTYVCEKRGSGYETLAKLYLLSSAKVTKVF